MSTTVGLEGSLPKRRFAWMTAAAKWADTIGPLVRDEMKAEAPIGKDLRAGRLRSSIRYERHTSGSAVSAEFAAYTPYAGYVVHGTKPHTIRPVAARYLHWKTDGTDHFSKLVHHPGTKANDFPRRAVDRMMPLVQRTFRDIMIAAIGDTRL